LAGERLETSAYEVFEADNKRSDATTAYVITASDKRPLQPSACFLVTDYAGMKKVDVHQRLKTAEFAQYIDRPYFGEIYISRNRFENSNIIFFTETFQIDAWGNLSRPRDLLFTGYMATLGVGDMLPANYGIDTSTPNEYISMNENMAVEQRLSGFLDMTPTEKIYVHQDRTLYMAGETVWFKAYQDFSKNDDPGSAILYVDLKNDANQTVLSGKWSIVDRMAFGQIELPDTLSSGNYQLIAYTRWMQNPGMENYFTREISVISPYAPQMTEEPQQTTEPSVELHLFPEGGHLVGGIPSKVAFKVTDQFGKGLDASGFITDQSGNEVRRFQTQSDGMGVFTFIPEQGSQYFAHLDHFQTTKDLPAVSSTGVAMELRYYNSQIRVVLRHNLDIIHTQYPFYLTIHQKGAVYFTSQVDMTQASSMLDIPVGKLPEGIFTITVYDENLNAWCERLAFACYPQPLQLQLTTGQETVERRKKVTVEIAASDCFGSPQSGNFSLAVVGSDLDGTEQRNNYYSDYFLQSELKGIIENPASYFEEMDSVGQKRLDLLLLTHGWRTYAWDDMMAMVSPDVRYPVETGLGFAGRVELGRRLTGDQVSVTAFLRLDSIQKFLYGQWKRMGHSVLQVIISVIPPRSYSRR